MKPLKALINKDNLHKFYTSKNLFGLTKKDLIKDLKGFPMGIVVRMMEEQKNQGNTSDVKVFQEDYGATANDGGFDWDLTEYGEDFWYDVLSNEEFDKFFEKYPEYKKYNLK